VLNPRMQHSQQGLDLTKRFECCKRTAYLDVRGVWTIGWGTTGPEIHEGLVWTQDEADSQLISRYHCSENDVNNFVNVPLTQGEFDALCDFDYNAGGGALKNSTLLKLLNAKDYEGAAKEFERWTYAGGKQVAGLLRRRLAEEQEFKS